MTRGGKILPLPPGDEHPPRQVTIRLDLTHGKLLKQMADQAGLPVSKLAASIVCHVLDDDAAAHRIILDKGRGKR